MRVVPTKHAHELDRTDPPELIVSLQHARPHLENEVRAAQHRPVFATARRRCPELAAHETPSSALAVLRDASEKETLARAILGEHAQSPHPLWATMLLLACYPMLRHLRRRIHGDTVATDDVEQLIVITFLKVIAAFPLEHRRDRTFMHLRQMTQRRVFEHLRSEQREQECVCATLPDELLGDGQRSRAWPDMRPVRCDPDADEQAAQLAFLSTHAGHVLSPDKLDPVIATAIRGERITEYVDRVYPHVDPSERERIYQRVKRTHSRAMAKLRHILASLYADTKTCQDRS